VARLILVEDIVGPSVSGRGGAAVYVLQWAHGLRRLGHEVLLLEMLDEQPTQQTVSAFEQLTRRWWRGAPAALINTSNGSSLAGLGAHQVSSWASRASAVITLAAHYRRDPWPLIGAVRPRILVDQDPGYTHLWASEGDWRDVFGEHEVYLTVGANVGSERCRLPTLGLDWQPIYNPVVLDWWNATAPITRARFTTIASWRDYGYLEFEGQLLGPKVEQFQRVLELPARSHQEIELVVELDPLDPDRAQLRQHGWLLQDPEVVDDPERYRSYIQGSLAEFSVAKGGYVTTNSGWFSDRSACYLAAGRPVVLQATGFEDWLPTGEGLLAFRDLPEAQEAIARIRADYGAHSRAARAIAQEHLNSDRLLAELLHRAGVS
jgi:hypothetical protein